MEIYEAMSTLRAVRRLKTDPIPEEVLGRVLQAGAWAPSGGNVQPWRVVVVEDEQKKQALGDLYKPRWQKYGEGARKNLALLSGEVQAKQERMLKAADHLGEYFADAPAILVFCFNPNNMAITDIGLSRPTVVGGGSVYPAVQNIMLACRVEGLGCTLTTLLCFDEEAVKSLLNIPDDWYTCGFMPIGYPVLKGHGSISRRPIEKLAFRDSFGDSWS